MRQLKISCVGIVLLANCLYVTSLWSSQTTAPSIAATGIEKAIIEKEAKEKTEKRSASESRFVCHVPTLDEEFAYLKWEISEISFCRKNYPQHKVETLVPRHRLFQEICQKPTIFSDLGDEAVKKIFQSEVYDEHAYAKAFEVISSPKVQDRVQCALVQLVALQRNWGFEIFPRYTIALTLYGPGGSYHPSISTIRIKTAPQAVPLRAPETIIHETVHMGIEENIVQKYKLAHWEKERLVDLICSLYLKEIVPDYCIQKSGDKKIDPFITLDAIVHNLPAAIESFVKQYPR